MKKRDVKFEDKLNSYSTSAKSLAVASRSGQNNWRFYAAATGSALAFATTAAAGIIYGNPNTSVSANSAANVNIDGVAFSINARFNHPVFTSAFTTSSGQRITSHHGSNTGSAHVFAPGGAGLLTSGGRLRRLSSGNLISSGGSFPSGERVARGRHNGTFSSGFSFNNSNFGQFYPSSTAFAGFKIGTNEFGWMRLHVGNDGGGFPTNITLIDWAVNTDGSIHVGDTGVPEPGTLGLLLLASGSAGILALRRRRKTA